MNCDGYPYHPTVSEDEDDPQQMPALLSFDWNPDAVAAFIIKLNGVNREGIVFPQFFGPFQPSVQGFKNFQFELLRMLARTSTGLEVSGVYNATTVAAKDHSSLCKFITRLATLSNEPWVQAVLQHGEPLRNKLVKVTVSVRGEPHDVFDFQNPLFH